jgi:hypothetical protein
LGAEATLYPFFHLSVRPNLATSSFYFFSKMATELSEKSYRDLQVLAKVRVFSSPSFFHQCRYE